MAAHPRRGHVSPIRAASAAVPWALGVAIGVALGGWITVTSGSGAPGAIALDVGRDLVLVPALAGLAVFVALFGVGLLFALVKSLRASADHHDRQDEHVEPEHQRIQR